MVEKLKRSREELTDVVRAANGYWWPQAEILIALSYQSDFFKLLISSFFSKSFSSDPSPFSLDLAHLISRRLYHSFSATRSSFRPETSSADAACYCGSASFVPC